MAEFTRAQIDDVALQLSRQLYGKPQRCPRCVTEVERYVTGRTVRRLAGVGRKNMLYAISVILREKGLPSERPSPPVRNQVFA